MLWHFYTLFGMCVYIEHGGGDAAAGKRMRVVWKEAEEDGSSSKKNL